MGFRGADRGQAMQVGAVILFGFLIVGLSLYQATVVTDQNGDVEFNAYQRAAADMTDLRNDVIAAAERDVTTGTNVRTGVEYPARTLFVNPGPPDNRVRTTERRNVTIENVTAVATEAPNARTFVSDSIDGAPYATRDVRFTPDYNHFGGQPMVVTGQQAYRTADGRMIPLSGQTLVQGDRLTLAFVGGGLDDGGSSSTITTAPVSAARETVRVTGADGEDVTVRFNTPPGVTAAEWNRTVGQRMRSANPDRVLGVDDSLGDAVEIRLNGSKTYRLRMSKVDVRERDDATPAPDPEPAYIVAREGDDQAVTSGQRATVAAQVRDEFNNPTGDANVEFRVTEGDARLLDEEGEPAGETRTVSADADGTAAMRLLTESADEDVVVTATLADGDPDIDTATFDVQVGAGAEATQGGGAHLVSFRGATADGPEDGDTTGARFTMRNADEQSIDVLRVTLERTTATADNINLQNRDPAPPWDAELTIRASDGGEDGFYETTTNLDRVDVGQTMDLTSPSGDDAAAPATIAADGDATFRLYRIRDGNQDVDMNGEFVEVTIVFESAGDRHEATTTLLLF